MQSLLAHGEGTALDGLEGVLAPLANEFPDLFAHILSSEAAFASAGSALGSVTHATLKNNVALVGAPDSVALNLWERRESKLKDGKSNKNDGTKSRATASYITLPGIAGKPPGGNVKDSLFYVLANNGNLKNFETRPMRYAVEFKWRACTARCPCPLPPIYAKV